MCAKEIYPCALPVSVLYSRNQFELIFEAAFASFSSWRWAGLAASSNISLHKVVPRGGVVHLLDGSGAPRRDVLGCCTVSDALAEARELQTVASGVGFDWPDISGALDKLREEVDELDAAIASGRTELAGAELGDVLFSAVNVSRFVPVDAEAALHGANGRFRARFERLRDRVLAQGKRLEACSLQELDAAWDALKDEARERGGDPEV